MGETKKIFKKPEQAYAFMNSWTEIQTSYETEFYGKKVSQVEIEFVNSKPTIANVYYTKGEIMGIEPIDLRKKGLRLEPKRKSLISRVKR